MKYFLYIRKSTDEDDRQVLSLEAQETELKEFALRENLFIAATFRESQTAKEPGRPIFNDMLKRMERGEAEGILAWHPDRLARNSIDGGRIIFLIDTGKIKALKSPTFWFEPTPQGKFMLNIAFGQSKYFVDNFSENTKRGLRQKLRRGELPGYAPLGYLNDLLKHTMFKDPERFRLVKKIIRPPSMLFLANLSGCHAKIPSASPLSIRLSISLKIGLPGSLAVCDSRKVAAIKRFSRKANSFNSVSCASNDKTCLSSSSVDFLMYKKYFISLLGC